MVTNMSCIVKMNNDEWLKKIAEMLNFANL
jgi:hypothetical protein